MDPGELEGGGLAEAMGLVWVTWGHEERRVDFQTPGTTLYRTGGGDLGKVAERKKKIPISW